MLLSLPAPFVNLGRKLRQRPESVLLLLGLVVSLWLVVPLLGQATAPTSSESLIHGLHPTSAQNVKRAEVLTDGVQPRTGDNWNTDLTATFRGHVTILFDLGQTKDIRAAYLIGDGNDDYVLTISEDGTRFEPLWQTGAVSGNGMQPRSTSDLSGRGRYIRIGARGGDALYSIGEVQLFENVPEELPAGLVARIGLPEGERVRGHFLHLVLALGLMLFACRRESSVGWKILASLAPLSAGVVLIAAIHGEWPLGASEVAMARAASAAIAAIVILREVIAPKRYPSSRAVVIPTLALSAVLAFASFFNLGRAQFQDHDKGRQTFVHTFDMRVYYPVAKYFPELRFDGLYLASVAAYMSDVPGSTRAKMQNVQFRDLKTHRMVRAGDVWDQVLSMEKRFTPERWEAFLKDMRYFRLTMGRDYLGSMVDHGGNATPVWLAIGYVIFSLTEANEPTLVIGGLLDPLLLLLAFFAVGWAYGWRPALLCMVIFGANDFVMLGSNWAGATLRHDWLAFLLFAMAALKMNRYALGGVLLAMATSARAFPALALVSLAFPIMGWLLLQRYGKGAWPSRQFLWETHRDTVRVWISAIAAGLALFLFASAILSFGAWPEWLRKVSMLDSEPHLNQVSLRALVAGTDFPRDAILAARKPLFLFLAIGSLLATGFVAWRRSIDQAAILGCMLIPVIFNPANYYIHFITILPLLACASSKDGSKDKGTPTWNQALIWWALLLLCVAQYWTTKVQDRTLHFELATVLLFVSFALALVGCHRMNKETLIRSEATG